MAEKRFFSVLRRCFPVMVSAALFLVLAGHYISRSPVTTVFLIRHAEKAVRPAQDPPLTRAGLERAETLCRLLMRADVSAVYSTRYRRTRQTVQPLSDLLDLRVNEYEARDFEGLARRIRSDHRGKTLLVAGHSNTVPGIIRALGADPVSPIADEEYDNLYGVTIIKNKSRIFTLKFGQSGPDRAGPIE
jgi:broad specificity phosphatase PhoE